MKYLRIHNVSIHTSFLIFPERSKDVKIEGRKDGGFLCDIEDLEKQ